MKTFRNEIIELLKLKQNTTSEELLVILENYKNNKIINEYVEKYLEYLVIGISNIVNIINPERICIGGSFTYYEEIFYKKLQEKVNAYKYQFNSPEIVLAKLKNDAGIIGAIL